MEHRFSNTILELKFLLSTSSSSKNNYPLAGNGGHSFLSPGICIEIQNFWNLYRNTKLATDSRRNLELCEYSSPSSWSNQSPARDYHLSVTILYRFILVLVVWMSNANRSRGHECVLKTHVALSSNSQLLAHRFPLDRELVPWDDAIRRMTGLVLLCCSFRR